MINESISKVLVRPDVCAVGDLIWAPWGADGFLYPAVIVGMIDELRCHVAFLDGDEGPVMIKDALAGELQPGNPVSINFKGQGRYYQGTVEKVIGVALAILYEDGDRGFATLAQCWLPLTLPETRGSTESSGRPRPLPPR